VLKYINENCAHADVRKYAEARDLAVTFMHYMFYSDIVFVKL